MKHEVDDGNILFEKKRGSQLPVTLILAGKEKGVQPAEIECSSIKYKYTVLF